MIDIDKAFEGRWRIKANLDGTGHVKGAVIPFVSSEHQEEILSRIKSLCRDFFEAGICLGEGENCPPILMSKIMDAAADVAFEEWWDMYGKKVDRKKCIKKWKNLSYNEKQLCLNATPAYVASTPDIAYRKNPLTYLNGECWNDEIIVKNNGTSKPTTDQQRLERLADILTE